MLNIRKHLAFQELLPNFAAANETKANKQENDNHSKKDVMGRDRSGDPV
jgi:hypothetical protein